MKISIVILVAFSISAVSTRATDDLGISPYCRQSQLSPTIYGPTPVECCDYRGACNETIGPNETKYGLTNPDPEWSRRSCSCDKRLFACVKNDRLKGKQTSIFNAHGFQYLICFRPIFTSIGKHIQYEFTLFQDAMHVNSWAKS